MVQWQNLTGISGLLWVGRWGRLKELLWGSNICAHSLRMSRNPLGKGCVGEGTWEGREVHEAGRESRRADQWAGGPWCEKALTAPQGGRAAGSNTWKGLGRASWVILAWPQNIQTSDTMVFSGFSNWICPKPIRPACIPEARLLTPGQSYKWIVNQEHQHQTQCVDLVWILIQLNWL